MSSIFAARFRSITVVPLAAAVVTLLLSCGGGSSTHAPRHAMSASRPQRALPPASGATLVAELGCAACHVGIGASNSALDTAPALAEAAARYSPGALFAVLADSGSTRQRTGRARMPDFHLDESERLALTLYLGTLRGDAGTHSGRASSVAADDSRRLDAELARVHKAHPDISASTGERIFIALNCAGCHAVPGVTPWLNGPDLSAEGSRVRPEWLRDYLARPRAVRPFGTYPGTGSRMPDFRLTSDEADSLAAYLDSKRAPLPAFQPRPLSVFAQREAESLLKDQLPCLGCHELGSEGGRIGPSLSSVRDRLQPAYIHAMISDPGHTAAWTIMPRVPMPPRTLELIATYLATRPPTPAAARYRSYLSLTDHPPIDSMVNGSTSARTGPALYRRICANCHGVTGKGDGWNASYLPVRPTMHADARYMSTRPDGTLYDGIAGGGAILGRSNRMPPFGGTLSRAEIRSLVTHIRTLCRCSGPAWSRDGVTP